MTEPTGQVWDACSLLNVAATGHAAEILGACRCPSYVVREVLQGEALFLRPLPEDDPNNGLIPVDLTPLLASGVLIEVMLNDNEQAPFVHFAALMDDGESRSAAVALNRGCRLVTDDRLALRVAREHTPPIITIDTPELIHQWAELSRIDDGILATTLRRIQICAKFQPRRTHQLHEWWISHLP
jgi:hypothetical protein